MAMAGGLSLHGPRHLERHRVDTVETDPLALVGLPDLMELTRGHADVIVGLLDGPVMVDHPDLASGNITSLAAGPAGCREPACSSCAHGTFIAGILAARRGSGAPAIAPDCTILIRPIFSERTGPGELPSATPDSLAQAIVDCVDAGARLLNLSVAMAGGPVKVHRELEDAFRYATRRGALVVAAAGNQGLVTGSVITQQWGAIPVVGYDLAGRMLEESNLGRSIGGGVGAAGEGVISLMPTGGLAVSGGTSVAAPFVTGTAALLWSMFPEANAMEIRRALVSPGTEDRRSVVPPLMRAWHAYEALSTSQGRRWSR